MNKPALGVMILALILTGCAREPDRYTAKDIVKITDFELSPDESKIAFSATGPAGNLDIWIVDIYGKNLKKLTFQGRSPTNRIAKFFKKQGWKNFFEIDMRHPEWTIEGRIAFCQELTKCDMWGPDTVSLRFWTINSNGTDKRPKTDKDKVSHRRPYDSLNRAEISDRSGKYKKKILLRNNDLWFLNDGEDTPHKLIQ